MIRIRFPDRTTLQATFLSLETGNKWNLLFFRLLFVMIQPITHTFLSTVGTIYDFVAAHIITLPEQHCDKPPRRTFTLYMTPPMRTYTNTLETLHDAGLAPATMLYLRFEVALNREGSSMTVPSPMGSYFAEHVRSRLEEFPVPVHVETGLAEVGEIMMDEKDGAKPFVVGGARDGVDCSHRNMNSEKDVGGGFNEKKGVPKWFKLGKKK
jgi:hypothetical protein